MVRCWCGAVYVQTFGTHRDTELDFWDREHSCTTHESVEVFLIGEYGVS